MKFKKKLKKIDLNLGGKKIIKQPLKLLEKMDI